jgi:RimJ/RimL family protein N-acetyltransferase
MDFKKLTSSPTPKTSPKALVALSYKILAGMEINFQGHMINPLRSDDIPKLFTWHKQKSSSLLPDHPLGGLGGDEFLDSINENLQKPNPEAVHVRLDHTETLIGIAGFTNIKWDDLNAKTYFFLDPEKSDNPALFGRYCSIILHLLMRCAFITLKLDKISIETAGSEIMLAHTIEASGFRREAEFKEYAVLNGRNVSMIYASCTKEDYFRVFPN